MSKNQSTNIVEELSILLADTYSLALKTQNYHWNVTCAEFYSLHKLFEDQYESLHSASDELAERIRALGAYAVGGFGEFAKLTNISDAKPGISSKEMLKDLAKSHETAVRQARKVIEAAEAAGDNATVDIVVGRIEEHDKQAWMLNSSL
jgi:starvation-inducible DNA-binding protein